MDVQAAAAAATPAPISAPPSPAPESPPSPTAGPVPVASAVGAAGQSASNQQSDSTLSPVVAKLFNTAEADVQVSFQVLTDPDEVVTVFTNKATGKEIIQFPSQALIALAEMYDKDAGKVLDKSV